MIVTLAVVTFLLTNGSQSVMTVFPPGGDYHPQFGFMCERNRPQMLKMVRTMVGSGLIKKPEATERMLGIQIFCSKSVDL